MSKRDKFLDIIEPHFDAGYNLARWLTRDDADAADVFQDSCVKAFRFFEDLKEKPRAWFLQIVRNSAYTHLKKNRMFVDEDFNTDIVDSSPNAETLLIESVNFESLRQALNDIAVTHREILVLRELEEMSYEDIAKVLEIPTGTVMSRLSRARDVLKKKLIGRGGRA